MGRRCAEPLTLHARIYAHRWEDFAKLIKIGKRDWRIVGETFFLFSPKIMDEELRWGTVGVALTTSVNHLIRLITYMRCRLNSGIHYKKTIMVR